MKSIGKNLFARSRFTYEQNSCIGWRNSLCKTKGFLNNRAISDNIFKAVGSSFFYLDGRFFLSKNLVHCLANQWNDSVIVIAFRNVVKAAVLDRLDAIRNITVCGKKNNFNQRIFGFCFFYKIN